MIQLHDERYWLYAPCDPETNELLQSTLEPTSAKLLATAFCTDVHENHDVDDTACSSPVHPTERRLQPE